MFAKPEIASTPDPIPRFLRMAPRLGFFVGFFVGFLPAHLPTYKNFCGFFCGEIPSRTDLGLGFFWGIG